MQMTVAHLLAVCVVIRLKGNGAFADARACDKYLQEIAKDPDVRASAVSAQKLEIPACSALLVTDVVVHVVVDFSDEWTAQLLS